MSSTSSITIATRGSAVATSPGTRSLLQRIRTVLRELGDANHRMLELRLGRPATPIRVAVARHEVRELESLYRLPSAAFGGRAPRRFV